MNFDIPNLLFEMPTKSKWKSIYPDDGFQAKLAFEIAARVYWRTIISERQNHRCCYCGIRTTDVQGLKYSATIEHILPKSQGGKDDPENYALACSNCNGKRRDKPLDVFLHELESNVNLESEKVALREKLKKAEEEAGVIVVIKNQSKPSRLKRKLDSIEVIKHIQAGLPNTFEPGSRKYNIYVKYIQNQNIYEWRLFYKIAA